MSFNPRIPLNVGAIVDPTRGLRDVLTNTTNGLREQRLKNLALAETRRRTDMLEAAQKAKEADRQALSNYNNIVGQGRQATAYLTDNIDSDAINQMSYTPEELKATKGLDFGVKDGKVYGLEGITNQPLKKSIETKTLQQNKLSDLATSTGPVLESELELRQRAAEGLKAHPDAIAKDIISARAADVESRKNKTSAIQKQMDELQKRIDKNMLARETELGKKGTNSKGKNYLNIPGYNTYNYDKVVGKWKDKVTWKGIGWDDTTFAKAIDDLRVQGLPDKIIDKIGQRAFDEGFWDNSWREAKNGSKKDFINAVKKEEVNKYTNLVNKYKNSGGGTNYRKSSELARQITADNNTLNRLNQRLEASGVTPQEARQAKARDIFGKAINVSNTNSKNTTKTTPRPSSWGTENIVTKAFDSKSPTALGDLYKKDPNAFTEALNNLNTNDQAKVSKALNKYTDGAFGSDNSQKSDSEVVSRASVNDKYTPHKKFTTNSKDRLNAIKSASFEELDNMSIDREADGWFKASNFVADAFAGGGNRYDSKAQRRAIVFDQKVAKRQKYLAKKELPVLEKSLKSLRNDMDVTSTKLNTAKSYSDDIRKYISTTEFSKLSPEDRKSVMDQFQKTNKSYSNAATALKDMKDKFNNTNESIIRRKQVLNGADAKDVADSKINREAEDSWAYGDKDKNGIRRKSGGHILAEIALTAAKTIPEGKLLSIPGRVVSKAVGKKVIGNIATKSVQNTVAKAAAKAAEKAVKIVKRNERRMKDLDYELGEVTKRIEKLQKMKRPNKNELTRLNKESKRIRNEYDKAEAVVLAGGK